MKFKQIKLINVGPFLGNHELNFSDQTTIISANNGSGKTTITKALSFILWPYEKNVEYEKLRESLICNFTDEDMEIELNLEINNDQFLIKKVINQEKMVENYTIYKNQIKLSGEAFLNQTEKFNEIFYDFEKTTIIDCEKIFDIVDSKQRFGNFIKKILHDHYKIDRFDMLKQSIDEIEFDDETLNSIEQEYQNIIASIKSLETNILGQEKDQKSLIIRKDKKLATLAEHYANLDNSFNLKEEEIESYFSSYHKVNYDLVNTQLPLSIIEKEIEEVAAIIKKNSKEYINYINKLIAKEDAEKPFFNAEILNYLNNIDEHKSALQVILKDIELEVNSSNIIFENSMVKKELEKISDLNDKITQIDDKISKLNSNLETYAQQFDDLNVDKSKIRRRLNKEHASSSNFELLEKLNQVAAVEKEILITKLNESISQGVHEKFSILIRKKDWVKEILFSKVNFNIRLVTEFDQIIDYSRISAGEKQLLLFAFLQYVHELKNESGIFFVDTPLARLDKANRKTIMDNVYTSKLYQTCIFTTDSELSLEELKELHDQKNAKIITLEFNEKLSRSEINEKWN